MTRLLPEHFRPDGKAKRSHPSEHEGHRKAAERAQAQGGSKRRPYHAYQCYCGSWHVGRKAPKGRRKRPGQTHVHHAHTP